MKEYIWILGIVLIGFGLLHTSVFRIGDRSYSKRYES